MATGAEGFASSSWNSGGFGSAKERHKSLLEEMDDILECPICQEIMTKPKILPCTHTFCFACLETYHSQRELSGEKSTCPVCREPFTASEITSLPDNLLTKKLLEFRDRMKSTLMDKQTTPKGVHCENCSEEGQGLAGAVKYCQECNQRLCQGCVDAHKLLKVTSGHRLVDLVPEDEIQKVDNKCPLHPSNQVSAYCEDCYQGVCQDCLEEDHHQYHRIADLDKLEARLSKVSTRVRLRTEHLKQLVKASEEGKATFLLNTSRVEDQIRAEAQRLRSLVNDGELRLLAELESFKRVKFKEAAQYTNEAELSLLMLRSSEGKLKQVTDLVTKGANITEAVSAGEVASKDVDDLLNVRLIPPAFASMKFKSSGTTSNTQKGNVVGRIETNPIADGKGRKPLPEKDCIHYKRHCLLVASCCSRMYSCRFCHDEKEDHKMDRFQVKEVCCFSCGTRQPVAKWCRTCDIEFGRYFCATCRMFDDNDKNQFHCNECAICRTGGQNNFWHCSRCGMCLSKSLLQGHACVEGTAKAGCPVCHDDVFSTTAPLKVLPCGHIGHQSCLGTLQKCSLCKSTEKEADQPSSVRNRNLKASR